MSTVLRRPAALGLSPKEISRYSIARAIHQLASDPRDRSGFEFEVSSEIAKRLQQPEPRGFFVPDEIQRDLSVGLGSQPTDGAGLVGSGTNPIASFIEVLRSNIVAMKLGARMLSGLVGNVSVPRMDSSGVGYWVSEGGAISNESQQEFSLLHVAPKTCGTVTELSRNLLIQSSPSAEALIRSDLAQVLAHTISLALIAGTGGVQPTGILNTTGVVDGTTGAANGVDFNHDDSIDMETTVRNANAYVNSPGWLLNPDVAGTLKKRPKIAGFPFYLVQDGKMNNHAVHETTQIPANSGIFGDFSQVIICEWGILEFLANPYGVGSRAGNAQVRALQSIDIIVRHPEAFTKFEAFS